MDRETLGPLTLTLPASKVQQVTPWFLVRSVSVATIASSLKNPVGEQLPQPLVYQTLSLSLPAVDIRESSTASGASISKRARPPLGSSPVATVDSPIRITFRATCSSALD
jgi:hypothetical protein